MRMNNFHQPTPQTPSINLEQVPHTERSDAKAICPLLQCALVCAVVCAGVCLVVVVRIWKETPGAIRA